jgi:hypothetical protein
LEQSPIQSPGFHFFALPSIRVVESRVRAMRLSGWTIGEFEAIPKLFPGVELPMDTPATASGRARVADLQVRGARGTMRFGELSRGAAPDQVGRGTRVSTAST